MTKLYVEIHRSLVAYKNSHCFLHSVNEEWKAKHLERLEVLEDMLPSGSGFDSGCKINVEASSKDKIVFSFEYHHMNEDGYYVGWTNYIVTVTPAFEEFDIDIQLREDDEESKELWEDMEDYIYDTLYFALGN